MCSRRKRVNTDLDPSSCSASVLEDWMGFTVTGDNVVSSNAMVESNEEQIKTAYPIDGAMGSSGGGRISEVIVRLLHNNAIVARGILVTIALWDTRTPPPTLLVLLEPHYLEI